MRTIELALLVSLVATMYLLPGRMPELPVSLHGLLLLPLLMIGAVAHPRRLLSLPVLICGGLLAVLIASAVSAGRTGPDVFRPFLFGALTMVAVIVSARRRDLRVLFLVLSPILVIDAAIGSTLRLWTDAPPYVLAMFDGPLSRPLHRGAFFLLALLALGAVYLRTMKPWLLLPFTILSLGVITTALRGIWVGAGAGLLLLVVLDRRPRAFVLAAIAGLTFLAVQDGMQTRLENTGDLARAAGSALPDPPSSTTEEPAPVPPAGSVAPPTVAATSGPTPAPASPGQPPPTEQARLPGQSQPTQEEVRAATYALDFAVKSGPSKFFEELSSAGRVGYWRAGIRMALAHPVLGVGPGNFVLEFPRYASGARRDAEPTSDPHSVLFGVLAELGFAGAFLLVLLLTAVVRGVWRQRAVFRTRPELVACVTGLAALCAVGLTWDLHLQRVWWLAIGMAVVASTPDPAADPA